MMIQMEQQLLSGRMEMEPTERSGSQFGRLKEVTRLLPPEESEALVEICEYNEITEEQVLSAPETIKSIEMFMHNIPRICCMSFFPNLISLTLVQQNITCIQGLDCLPNLEILRLNENRIRRTYLKLVKALKDIEKEMIQASEFEKVLRNVTSHNVISDVEEKNQEDWWAQSEAKANDIINQLTSFRKRMDHLRNVIRVAKAREEASIDNMIRWLLVELDTGGNIRMESGSAKDTWFRNCVDLVLSRFCIADYAHFGITGVRVQKVTRIHNRFLQDQFEKFYEVKVSHSHKRHVEYLLYGESMKRKDELQCIIEEGFASTPSNAFPGSDGPILLSNSIGLADYCRLHVLIL